MPSLEEQKATGRRLVVPFRLLGLMLYGEFDWLERSLPLIVLPTTQTCKQLRTTPQHYQDSLDWLERSGIIKEYQWRHHYATITIEPPIGMDISLNKEKTWTTLDN